MFDENLSKNIKALAYEKQIDVERVFKALEDALATAARKYYKTREPMETVIDRSSGEMTMYVIKEVVEDENQIEDPQAQWTLEQAKKIDPEVEVRMSPECSRKRSFSFSWASAFNSAFRLFCTML